MVLVPHHVGDSVPAEVEFSEGLESSQSGDACDLIASEI